MSLYTAIAAISKFLTGGDDEAPTPAPDKIASNKLSAAPEPDKHVSSSHNGNDEIVAPAHPYLKDWTPEERAALRDMQIAAGLDPKVGGIAGVIMEESGGDPRAPRVASGTPRGGLIQITVGANLPGYGTAEKVWAIRDMSRVEQLKGPITEFYRRMPVGLKGDGSVKRLLRAQFLPADISKPDDFPLGDGRVLQMLLRDDKSLTREGAMKRMTNEEIRRNSYYEANKGFDRTGKGYFTWTDVDARAGNFTGPREQWITVSGRIVGKEGTQKELPTAAAPAVPATDSKPDVVKLPSDMGKVAPAIWALVSQLDQHWPKRSKLSDGTLGDAAHQMRKSDHNDGNALDITNDPENGPDLETLATNVLLKDPRTAYVIFNKRIANTDPKFGGGAWRPYNEDPHTRHLHLSIKSSCRDNAGPWPDASIRCDPITVANNPAPAGTNLAAAKKSLLQAWKEGRVDNVVWVPLKVGPYDLFVSADYLAVNGLRIPVSWNDVLEICASRPGILPVTKAIVDARGSQGKKVIAAGFPKGPNYTWSQIEDFNRRIGPINQTLLGPSAKEWLLYNISDWTGWQPSANCPGGATPELRALNYGMWNYPDGTKFVQSPGHCHDANYGGAKNDSDAGDYSQLMTLVQNVGKKNGKTISVIDDLAKGCELGGPIPENLVSRIKRK